MVGPVGAYLVAIKHHAVAIVAGSLNQHLAVGIEGERGAPSSREAVGRHTLSGSSLSPFVVKTALLARHRRGAFKVTVSEIFSFIVEAKITEPYIFGNEMSLLAGSLQSAPQSDGIHRVNLAATPTFHHAVGIRADHCHRASQRQHVAVVL